MSVILEWSEVLIIAAALALLVINFVTVRMHVPTPSMIPTIEPKDSFFVDRLSFWFRDPQPGDIVVFWHTDGVLVDSVDSRLLDFGIAPGDELRAVNNRQIYTLADANRIVASLADGSDVFLQLSGAPSLPVGTKTADTPSLSAMGITFRERRMRYVKRLIAVGGQMVHVRNGDVYVDGVRLEGPAFDRFYTSTSPRMTYGVTPTEVPEGHWFVLGDNSDNSLDSRFWGFVDTRDFIGEPFFRVLPLDRFGLMNGYFGTDT